MQIKLNLDVDNLGLIPPMIIEVSGDADFLEIFKAINQAMRDECIYEDDIQSIDFDSESRVRLRHELSVVSS